MPDKRDKPPELPEDVRLQLQGLAQSMSAMQARVELLMLAVRTAAEALNTVAAMNPDLFLAQREAAGTDSAGKPKN